MKIHCTPACLLACVYISGIRPSGLSRVRLTSQTVIILLTFGRTLWRGSAHLKPCPYTGERNTEKCGRTSNLERDSNPQSRCLNGSWPYAPWETGQTDRQTDRCLDSNTWWARRYVWIKRCADQCLLILMEISFKVKLKMEIRIVMKVII
jgi:hypothetical protein